MNTRDANYVIAALNEIASLVCALAADVEARAWEGIEDHAEASGVRPLAAAQLADQANHAQASNGQQPVAQQCSEQEAASTTTAKKKNKSDEPVVSLEQVRGILAAVSAQGYTDEIRALIEAAGAHRLSKVDPAKYAWLLEQAEGISHAAE